MSYVLRFGVALLLSCGISSPAFAQESGARVAGFFAGAFGEGETNIAAGGAVGYRFTPRVGFEFEALALPELEFSDTGESGRGVAFLTNFVAEFPSPARWLTPYVQGGGGVANISRSGLGRIGNGDPRRDARRDIGRFGSRGDFADGTRLADDPRGPAETGVAMSVGGGIDFTVWKGLAVGPSLSYIKLFGSVTDRDLTRIGFRTTYRF